MKLLIILDSRLRGNDMFFQSVPSLSVIPAKAGIQELIDNWRIVDKQISNLQLKASDAVPGETVILRIYHMHNGISEARFWCNDRLIDVKRKILT